MANNERILLFLYTPQDIQNILLLAAVGASLLGTFLAQQSQKETLNAHNKALAVDIYFKALQMRRKLIKQFESDMTWFNEVRYPPFKISPMYNNNDDISCQVTSISKE